MIENIIHSLPLPLLVKSGDHWNFRCVVCGDSKKDPKKKRGWILVNGTKVTYYCHNCGYNKPILSFLKDHFPEVGKEYAKIMFKTRRDSSKLVQTEVVKDTSDNQLQNINLQKLCKLDDDHEAKKYFARRQFPIRYLRYFYWTDNFRQYVNSVIPDKFEKVPEEDPRIIIPFYTQHRKIFAVQGRSLTARGLRYITIKFDEGHKKVFGLERMNRDKTILVLEGAFDSIFLPNAIAFGGADLDLNYLKELAPMERYIFCYDNEPRNKEMCKRIEKVLKAGFRVCLMPEKLKRYGKDINDLVMGGLSIEHICVIIKENIVEGKMGLVKFRLWKKGK